MKHTIVKLWGLCDSKLQKTFLFPISIIAMISIYTIYIIYLLTLLLALTIFRIFQNSKSIKL